MVDDEPDVVAMLTEMLEQFGCEVYGAATGDAAIAVMASARPQVVLLDLMMPGLPGLDALAYFQAHHRRVPVIVITARLDPEVGQQARQAGAFDVLGKPFNLATLQGLVAEALRLAPRAPGDAPR